jgi:hypothetical protein
MRLPWPFSPLESGEIDDFAFDFSADIGGATIVSTSWSCFLTQNQSPSVDPDPQSHILSTMVVGGIERIDPITDEVETIAGNFSVATIGGLPSSAVGTVYGLEAKVSLTDGRVLTLSSTVLCAPAPPPDC